MTDIEINAALLHLQFYLYLCLRVWQRYRRPGGSSATGGGTQTTVWVATILAVSAAAHTLVMAKSLAWIGGRDLVYARLQMAVGVVAVVVTLALTLAALLRQPLFSGVPTRPFRRVPTIAKAAAPIDGATIGALRRYMEERRPFLEPELSIRALARRVGLSQRDLSAALNRELDVHFFDFVNGYRVEHAARLLIQSDKRQMTILEVAHASGFNSKSSFNAAFVKLTGRTPSSHRRSAAGPTPEGAFAIVRTP